MKLNNRIQAYSRQIFVGGALLICAVLAITDDVIESPAAEFQLPDFTRTYGHDFGPDVQITQKPKLSVNARLKKWGQKVKKTLQKNKGDNLQYGIQKYTKYTGQRRYGVGFKVKIDEVEQENVTIHGHGISYERQKLNSNYFMGLDTRNPVDVENNIVDDKEDDEDRYIYFGIKVTW